MATIYIHPDDAYRTHVEDITKKDLFFSPIYKRAQECAKDIINTTKRYHREKNASALPINPLRLKGYPNNIIAFSAHRGHGKTSAMLSFANGLISLNTPHYAATAPEFWDDDLKKNRYYIIDAIDPTTLEAKDSIIRTIISRMFTKFVEHSEDTYQDHRIRSTQQKLLQKFQNCYRLADMQKTQPQLNQSYDDLQLLSDHGDSSNFKERFNDLIQAYLDLMDHTPNRKENDGYPFLVLQIDDADMNTAHAYDVVDDIRKYCMVPNVIILFATDLEQLKVTVEQHFVDAHRHILSNIIPNDPDSLHAAESCRRSCRRIAASYLDKLIPGVHRISLPDIDAELRNPMQDILLKIEGTDVTSEKTGLAKVSEEQNHPKDRPNAAADSTYQHVLLEMLRRKTLLEMQPSAFRRHPFLPKRMRELNHFVHILSGMPDIHYTRRDFLLWAVGDKNDAHLEEQVLVLRENLEKIMDYFLNDWIDLQLRDSRQFKIIDDIHRATADAKLDTAINAIDKRYSRSTSLSTIGSWENLTERINFFHKQHEHEFAYALELYFLLYKELMMVHDYLASRTRRNNHEP